MKANGPTNPNPPLTIFHVRTTYGIDGSDGNSKILENEKFLHAWNYIYIKSVQYIKYMYIT